MKDYNYEILNKLKKFNFKKIIIVTIITLLVFSIIFVLYRYVEDKKIKDIVNNKQYSSYKDFESAKEYIIYSGNKYIKEQNSNIDGVYKDIYLTFKEEPFVNGKSNEQEYMSLINIVANTLNYSSFRLIDEEKNLTIFVECNQKDKTVMHVLFNGEENYFSKIDSLNSLNNFSQNERNLEIQSEIIKNLIEQNWSYTAINHWQRKAIENDYFIYDEFMTRTISKKIYNIVFFKNYSQDVLNNLKVGASREKIEKELGEPDFDSLGIIGYKGKDIYVFFGKNTISIYRVENAIDGNDEFIELLNQFRQNGDSKEFISKLTDIWDDYNEYKVENNYIYIEYALRGLKIQFNVTDEHGVIFYKNYKGQIEQDITLSSIKNIENYKLPKYTYIYGEVDLLLDDEIERAFKFGEISS